MNKKSAVVSGFSFAMQLGSMMDEIRRELGVSEEEFHVLGTTEGRTHLELMIAGLKVSVTEVPQPKTYLRQLYVGKKTIIDPTDGTETIAQAETVFTWGIDSDFKNWGLDVPAQATEATEATVHEMTTDGAFKEIYGSLGRTPEELKKLCLTQAQIIGFCSKHRDKLRQEGYGMFFLFEHDGKLFVANVNVRSGGRLSVFVLHFSRGDVWNAECRHRFVFPQLEPLVALVTSVS